MRARGTTRERQVERILRDEMYLTASLRHLGGAGDLLAIPPVVTPKPPLIIEVKGTTDLPWRSTWSRAQRHLLLRRAWAYACEPMLCWWPPGHGPFWIPAEEWPT